MRTPGGTDFFLCLDSAAGTMGRSQMEWLRKALEDASRKDYRHCVVFTHTHMFKKDGSQGHTSNYAMEETLELTGLLTRYGVGMYIAGHDHSREITRLGGVDYITVDAMEESAGDPAYMVLNMGELMTFDFVEIM